MDLISDTELPPIQYIVPVKSPIIVLSHLK